MRQLWIRPWVNTLQVVLRWWGEHQCCKLLSRDAVAVQVWNCDVTQLWEMVVDGQMVVQVVQVVQRMVEVELVELVELVVGRAVLVAGALHAEEVELVELDVAKDEDAVQAEQAEQLETREARGSWFAPMVAVEWSFQYHPKLFKCLLPSTTGAQSAASRWFTFEIERRERTTSFAHIASTTRLKTCIQVSKISAASSAFAKHRFVRVIARFYKQKKTKQCNIVARFSVVYMVSLLPVSSGIPFAYYIIIWSYVWIYVWHCLAFHRLPHLSCFLIFFATAFRGLPWMAVRRPRSVYPTNHKTIYVCINLLRIRQCFDVFPSKQSFAICCKRQQEQVFAVQIPCACDCCCSIDHELDSEDILLYVVIY